MFSTFLPIRVVLFLSTLSLRRATLKKIQKLWDAPISIHALLAESDRGAGSERGEPGRFLSTLSLRRATGCQMRTNRARTFLSTLSLRRATKCYQDAEVHGKISIHALLAESDPPLHGPRIGGPHFYPRSPCGERPLYAARPCAAY